MTKHSNNNFAIWSKCRLMSGAVLQPSIDINCFSSSILLITEYFVLLFVTNKSNGIFDCSVKCRILPGNCDEKMYGSFIFYPLYLSAHSFCKIQSLIAQNVPFCRDEQGSRKHIQRFITTQAYADGGTAIVCIDGVCPIESFHDFGIQTKAFTILLP